MAAPGWTAPRSAAKSKASCSFEFLGGTGGDILTINFQGGDPLPRPGGDASAFEQLVRAYEGELFRLAYRMLGDRGEAEDAVQETFVVVWRQLPTLVDPPAFRAWIYHIATRRCLNVLQRRSRQRTDVTRSDDFEAETRTQAPVHDRGVGPEAAAQATAVRQSLEQVLATLPPEQRACWVLNELHDLTYPEIAFAIGVPLSTVRGRIARARQNLAKGMAAWR